MTLSRGRLIRPALILATALTVSGCNIQPPEVSAVEWRLESRPSESGKPYESLSVFGVVKDDDNLDNIVELWVVDDEAALSWKLTSADWIRSGEGGDTWIGGSALAQADFSPLPRGSYRLVAIDASGQRAERTFEVAGTFPDRNAPMASYAGSSLSIVSDWPETLVLAFDGTGALIASPGAPPGSSSLDEALGEDIAFRTAELGAYGYDPDLRMGAFSKRIKTR